MSIPKVIHCCWFGPREIPALERECMETWKAVLKDYRFVFWNEEHFDISAVPYVKEAYEHQKFAFVSDYVRMYALYKYGGIYLDTDVEVRKPFDPFLEDPAFIGFENRTMAGTGIIGAEKGAELAKKMLDYYHANRFLDENGCLNATTNVQLINEILREQGMVPKNSEQVLENIHVYERDVFCPKKMDDSRFGVTERTVTVHKFAGSWLTEREKRRGTSTIWRNLLRPALRKGRTLLQASLGEKRTRQVEMRLRTFLR